VSAKKRLPPPYKECFVPLSNRCGISQFHTLIRTWKRLPRRRVLKTLRKVQRGQYLLVVDLRLSCYFCQHFNNYLSEFASSSCRPILHRYANEDVSLGSWFIGLDVEHIDDKSLCCSTPLGKTTTIPFTTVSSCRNTLCFDSHFMDADCEWKAEAGNPCGASFDWSCSGICKSVERMEEVHQRCGEGEEAIWHTSF